MLPTCTSFLSEKSPMAEIQLTKGYVAIVDDEDFEGLSKFKWHVACSNFGKPYASRKPIAGENRKETNIRLHRFILRAKDGEHVDHINGDTLDNRRCNIRVCTPAENMRNRPIQSNSTSGYKGVSWHKHRSKWRAQIKINGRKKHLGYFDNPKDAYMAYCLAAAELHGRFANTKSLKT